MRISPRDKRSHGRCAFFAPTALPRPPPCPSCFSRGGAAPRPVAPRKHPHDANGRPPRTSRGTPQHKQKHEHRTGRSSRARRREKQSAHSPTPTQRAHNAPALAHSRHFPSPGPSRIGRRPRAGVRELSALPPEQYATAHFAPGLKQVNKRCCGGCAGAPVSRVGAAISRAQRVFWDEVGARLRV